MTASTPQTTNSPALRVQRIYIKDLSCESPLAPNIFQKAVESDLGIEFHVSAKSLENSLYEVELKVTVKLSTKTTNEPLPPLPTQTLLEIELIEAGIFSLEGFDSKQTTYHLNTTCPTILYPYASALISDLAGRTLATPLYLPPVNFEAVYLSQQTASSDKASN